MKTNPSVKFLSILILLALYSDYCKTQTIDHGTTIVVVRTKDRIIIGADSKGISVPMDRKEYFNDFSKAPSYEKEKLKKFGNVVVGAAGFYAYPNTRSYPKSDYDVYITIETIGSASDDILKLKEMFKVTIKQAIENGWEFIRSDYPRSDLSGFSLDLILCGFKKGTPFMFSYTFRPGTDKHPVSDPTLSNVFYPSAVIDSLHFPIAKAPFDTVYRQVFNDRIPKVAFSSIDKLAFSDPIDYVRKAILKAIELDSVSGGPIKILSITRNGIKAIPER
ncbi:MAG: hypothetical protein V1799_05110 [bacterium]